MGELRERMRTDMVVRGYSNSTIKTYLDHIKLFAKHFGRCPSTMGEDEIRAYQLHLAANLDLSQLVEQGKFRQDLYYRLNVFPIHLPPLRERLEDIPLLFEYFRKRLNRRHGKKIADIHPLALDALSRYPWPGNIRELENLIERAFIIETGRVLNPDSFPAEMFTAEPSASTDNKGAVNPPTLAEVRRRAVEEIERRYVRDLLTTHQGRIGRAAAAAGVTPRQLHNILGKYGIHKEDFKR